MTGAVICRGLIRQSGFGLRFLNKLALLAPIDGDCKTWRCYIDMPSHPPSQLDDSRSWLV